MKSSFRLFQFTHLKSSSYKEGTKTLESTLGLFCRIKTFRLQQNDKIFGNMN